VKGIDLVALERGKLLLEERLGIFETVVVAGRNSEDFGRWGRTEAIGQPAELREERMRSREAEYVASEVWERCLSRGAVKVSIDKSRLLDTPGRSIPTVTNGFCRHPGVSVVALPVQDAA